MRLSEYAKTPVRPMNAWASVGVVVVLLVVVLAGTGGHHMAPAGRGAGLMRWGLGGITLSLWAVALSQRLRYGRPAFPWQRAAYLIGYTLFMAGSLWPHPPPAVGWASEAGLLVVMALTLAPFFVFGKRADGPGETGSTSV